MFATFAREATVADLRCRYHAELLQPGNGSPGSDIVSRDRGKTVTKPLALSRLGLPLSEKQIPQVVENLESGDESREALETVALLVRQAL
jgi:hypothetical protein